MAKITANKTRFYHVSQAHLRVGTELRRGRGIEGHNAIFFTTSPVPHYTLVPLILGDAAMGVAPSKKPWYVYEIEACGYLGFGNCWDEGLATLATVIRCVGNARGILLNSSHTKPAVGSTVYRSQIQKARKRASR